MRAVFQKKEFTTPEWPLRVMVPSLHAPSTAALNCHRIILLIRNYELLIRNYELLIRIYELVIRNYEIVILNYGLVIRNYELRNRPHCQVQGDHIIVQSICAQNHLNKTELQQKRNVLSMNNLQTYPE